MNAKELIGRKFIYREDKRSDPKKTVFTIDGDPNELNARIVWYDNNGTEENHTNGYTWELASKHLTEGTWVLLCTDSQEGFLRSIYMKYYNDDFIIYSNLANILKRNPVWYNSEEQDLLNSVRIMEGAKLRPVTR